MTRALAILALALLLAGCGGIPLRAYIMKGRAPTAELGIPAYDRTAALVDSLEKEAGDE